MVIYHKANVKTYKIKKSERNMKHLVQLLIYHFSCIVPAVVYAVLQSVTASSLISPFSMVRWSACFGMINCLSQAEAVVRRGATHSAAGHWDWSETGRHSGPPAGKPIPEPWLLWTKSSEHLLVFWKLSDGVFILTVFLGHLQWTFCPIAFLFKARCWEAIREQFFSLWC